MSLPSSTILQKSQPQLRAFRPNSKLWAFVSTVLAAALLSCRSTALLQPESAAPLWQGWQENASFQQLDIPEALPQNSGVSVRFYYQRNHPEKSRAEIRAPLLPDTVLYARAALKKSWGIESWGIARGETSFFFPLELREAAIALDTAEGQKLELRYQLDGLLALVQLPAEPFFHLLRLGQLKLGLRQARGQAEQLARQYSSALELFTQQIFEHRAVAGPLPLIQQQMNDALTSYFFPETLTVRQQQLLAANYRQMLREKYQIDWPAQLAWSHTYSTAVFASPRFQRLRDSGQLWAQYQQSGKALQAFYNLRYAADIAIPPSYQLQKAK